MSEKDRVILKDFGHWVASGRGTKAEGHMNLILENQGNDIWKAIDYCDSSFSATGRSCGMFSDEAKYFDSIFNEIKELNFSADKKALEYLAHNKWAARDFFDVMKQINSPMHIGIIEEQPALLFSEHKAINSDSSNMQLYKKEYNYILPAEATYNKSVIPALTLYINEMKDIDNIIFPKLENNSMVWSDTSSKEFPKNLYGVPLHSICIGQSYIEHKNNLVISSDYNTKNLTIENASNVQILEGDFEIIKLNKVNRSVISPKVKTKKLEIENSSHIALPTSLGNVSNIDFGWGGNSNIYIYDKTPKDKVLITLEEEKSIAYRKGLLDYYNERYAEVVQEELHDIINSSNANIKASKSLKHLISQRNQYKATDEILNSDNKMQEILKNAKSNTEEQENMSLKDLYKKLQKRSGIANAELLATKKILTHFVK